MIQDIKPYTFDNQFIYAKAEDADRVVIMKDSTMLVKTDGETIEFPRWGQFENALEETVYLFAINNEETAEVNRFFYCKVPDAEAIQAALNENTEDGWKYEFMDQRNVQFRQPGWLGFAGTTAHQICSWYNQNQICGICGREMKRSEKERMVYCEHCETAIYPRINPVVIVGVTNGDKLLLTQYAHGPYRRYALVAGFAEVGETIEQTVEREVFEETGVRVKNLKFYKSQPWSMSHSLLFGFFCELDGSDEVSLNDGELSVAEWVHRDDIPDYGDKVSLTQEMIRYFKYNY